MPLQATSGAASYDAFGGGVPVVPAYIEEVFSAYLYTGTGASQTITNSIDLSTKGGLVWIKARGLNEGAYPQDHSLIDTVRGPTVALASNLTSGNLSQEYALGTGGTFNSNGFTIASTNPQVNASTVANGYASWTFRKQPKFFDVVTWTGTGANRTIAHSLGSVPGCIIVKRTDTTGAWQVYHRSLANTEYLVLNASNAKATGATRWNSTTATSSVFSVGTDATVNASGGTYVAYIFADDAGGFGLTGTDNVISCGSYTGNGSASGPTITLGYEPQFVIYKCTDVAYNWYMVDTMRGMPVADVGTALIKPNASEAEFNLGAGYTMLAPTATGFKVTSDDLAVNQSTKTYIYIAIRRGPMRVPTSGTSVFSPIASSASTGTALTTNFPVDMQIAKFRDEAAVNPVVDRLRGVSTTSTEVALNINTNSTDAESTATTRSLEWGSTGFKMPSWLGGNSSIFYNFRRAPQFFDEVCYTGTGSATTFTHNLSVTPELMIIKRRDSAGGWVVYSSFLGAGYYLTLQTTSAQITSSTIWNNTAPTSTVFTVGTASNAVNASGGTYVNYLFATCAGVSKVGNYTGNGSTQTINCGFGAGGARFVLIKRTDSTGDWYVYDTARGMTVLTDPYLLLNSTAAETATLGSVTTVSTGFALNATVLAAINTNAASYIFLAIA